MTENSSRVALFLRFLGGGGIERVILNLAQGFAEQGLKVDLVLSSGGGPHMWRVPPEVRIVDLEAPRVSACLPDLVRYLRRERPVALLSAGHYTNEVALWAKRLSRVSTRLVVSEHNNLSQDIQYAGKLKKPLMPLFIKLFYPWADSIVAVSHGVAKDLAYTTGLPLERIEVVYNPIVTPELLESAKEDVDHSWFTPGEPPVVLGVGKLEKQKDFPNLIRAFAQVRQVRQARLVILGWGPDRPQLEALVRELGIEDDVAMPGYVENPYAYMARAAVFVLSSAWEGFGNVIVEAMAVGTPVVSTDCPSGPAEILDNGKYGLLTSVGDSKALAEGILSVLSSQSKSFYPAWVDQFSLAAVTQQYFNVMDIT